MNRFYTITFAAIVGAAVALGSSYYFYTMSMDKLMTIERLSERSKSDGDAHRVNVMIPTEASIDFVDAASNTVNAVVHVKTTYELDGGYYTYDPIRHFFFGDGLQQKRPRQGAGAGSGVIMSQDGYIVTNNHVIDGASAVEVTLNENRTYKAKVVGRDPSTDLAVLKIDGENLPHIEFGNSDQVQVGVWVLAVGNPFNLESTVTAGIVSAKGRDINILGNAPNGASAVESFIQTDAAVNPGNSGGALVNTRGELIGINAAIKSNTGSYTGYSFAIPVNIVTKVVEDILTFGTVQRGFLGVQIQNVNQELAERQDLDLISGVYVANALDMGAAKDAGIQNGDVITRVGDLEVKTVSELQEQVSKYRPGDEVLLRVNRGCEKLTIPLVLRNQYGEERLTSKKGMQIKDKLNALFVDADPEILRTLKLKSGAQVKEVGQGKLKSAGILPDFVITKVDDVAIKSADQLMKTLESKSGGILIEGYYPNGKRAYYGFGI